MKKIKRSTAILYVILIIIFLSRVCCITIDTSPLIFIMSILSVICLIVVVVQSLMDMFDDYDESDYSLLKFISYSPKYSKKRYNYLIEGEYDPEPKNLKVSKMKTILISILVFFIIAIIWVSSSCGNQIVNVYNTSKVYNNLYLQKIDEKKGFYDKLWKTYLQKEKITNLNRETFLTVTKLIMENRKDGSNLAWKWCQENQQIPYEEFTNFYIDLSNFITSQREGYFNIEKECQSIANKNNTLLDTFPNNIYNKFLGCKRIKFEYGFLSDSTDNVFKTKKENIK